LSGTRWWSDLPHVRQFMAVYAEVALSPSTCLELGIYSDDSLRLNLLGASSARVDVHAALLPPWLFAMVEMAARDTLPFHVGLRITPPAEVRPEVYLVTIERPLPPWLTRIAGTCTPDLAMLGVSHDEVKRYVVEEPTVEFFGLQLADCRGRRLTQLCQTTLSGAARKRYLDVRPFPVHLQPFVRERVGVVPGSELPYGVIARSPGTWGFYAPLQVAG
jgi:hypothetical protein